MLSQQLIGPFDAYSQLSGDLKMQVSLGEAVKSHVWLAWSVFASNDPRATRPTLPNLGNGQPNTKEIQHG